MMKDDQVILAFMQVVPVLIRLLKTEQVMLALDALYNMGLSHRNYIQVMSNEDIVT